MPGVLRKTLPREFSPEENSLRIGLLILLNSLVLHSVLSEKHASIPTLNKIYSSETPLLDLENAWTIILKKHNHKSVFEMSKKILQQFNPTNQSRLVIKNLVKTAINITANQSALRHDLMGRVFHKLLENPKYLATYYTKIPVATLLVGLSFETELLKKTDFTKLDDVSKLKVADLACGSGTLLKSVLTAFTAKHTNVCALKNKKNSRDKLIKSLVEDNIFGYDILTSNAHLSAVSLAIHNSNVSFKNFNLYPMPAGTTTGVPSSPFSMGSLSLFTDSSTVSVGSQQTLTGESKGTSGINSDIVSEIKLPEINYSIMNPPFARSAYGTGVLNHIPNHEQVRKCISDLSKPNSSSRRGHPLAANLTASIGTYFISGITNLQKNLDGHAVQCLVIPKSLLSGSSWKKTRDELLEIYHFKYVVSTFEKPFAFSESTNLSEILLVLEKRDGRKSHQIIYLNLFKLPKSTYDSLTLLEKIRRSNPADVNPGGVGTCPVNLNKEKFGELVSIDERAPLALCANFLQTDAIRIAVNLLKNSEIINPVTARPISKIELDTVGGNFELGPDGRDVYDAFSPSTSSTQFPAFWGSGEGVSVKIRVEPNHFLNPRTTASPGRPLKPFSQLIPRMGTLLLPNSSRLTTATAYALRCSTPVLSNVWWVSKWKQSTKPKERQEMERRAALWFNSTFGIILIHTLSPETEIGFKKMPKTWWENEVKMINLSKLSKTDLKILDDCWKRIENKDLLSYSEIALDNTRQEIDAAWCKILNVPQNDLRTIQEIFSKEPMFTGRPPI